jgi:alkylhydroperoxidase/carboxymuconolactone decarboxylase family protein YurZ
MQHALQAGATKDEILESILIGSYMSMTRSQSYALREYAEMFQTDE